MAEVYIDHLTTLSMKENYGVVTNIVRKALVKGLSGIDYTVMIGALTAAGIPLENSFLDPPFAHLHLVDRDVEMLDVDTADVTLSYGVFNDKGQLLEAAGETGGGGWGANGVAGKMSVSVEQKKANYYRVAGVGEETLIVLEHTYPAEDPDFGGRTIQQTGEVDVYIPQRTLTIEGCKYTSNPWVMANYLIGCINGNVWQGQAIHTWMCTEVTWEFRAYPAFFISFTFQHNPDTWNPTAVFIDSRTDRPPQGLVADVGYKYIRYHPEVDFDYVLGFTLI